MANCVDGCGRNISEGRFIYQGLDFPLNDTGDLVVADLEETEFDDHTDHRGNNLTYSASDVTKATLTVSMTPCTVEYNELYEMWRCNKRMCGEAVVSLPCCGIDSYDAVRIQKMGRPSLSHDNNPIEVIFVGYVPSCGA